MTRVELHIEQVLLEGIDPRHAQLLGEALQLELQRQLLSAPVADSLRNSESRASVDGGEIALTRQPQPRALGASLAGAVRQGITGAARSGVNAR